MNEYENGVLNPGEYHPAADPAMAYIREQLEDPEIFIFAKSMFDLSILGNRTCQICVETLRRIQSGEPVSDRYLLGLAWILKEYNELKDNNRESE